jgi:hypothetical protein
MEDVCHGSAPIACADEPIGACCQSEDVIPPGAHQQHVAISATTMIMRLAEEKTSREAR